jgi:IclR family transcriptional regulator, KDG regulon repressor
MLGTVTRAGKALDLFTPERPTWGATAVSNELAIAKSQAHELLTSLTEIGLLRRVPGGRYRLGWRTLALGRHGLSGQFPDDTLRLMRAFAARYREPVHLVALDRDRLALVARYSMHSATNQLVPARLDSYLHCCAPARCLLADLPKEHARQLLDRPLERHTAATRVTVPAIIEELARVREERIAFDLGETNPGLRGVAVPIKDPDGHTLAALGVWTTADRWEQIGTELTRATAGVGQRVRAAMSTATASVAA